MSLVIQKARKKYKLSLMFEVIFFVITLALYFFLQNEQIISFFLGGIAVFLPHCFFVLFVFFIKQNIKSPLKKLYLSELIKFIFTILFIVIILKSFSVSIIAFLVGYVVGILLNNILPFFIGTKLSF